MIEVILARMWKIGQYCFDDPTVLDIGYIPYIHHMSESWTPSKHRASFSCCQLLATSLLHIKSNKSPLKRNKVKWYNTCQTFITFGLRLLQNNFQVICPHICWTTFKSSDANSNANYGFLLWMPFYLCMTLIHHRYMASYQGFMLMHHVCMKSLFKNKRFHLVWWQNSTFVLLG